MKSFGDDQIREQAAKNLVRFGRDAVDLEPDAAVDRHGDVAYVKAWVRVQEEDLKQAGVRPCRD